MRACGKCPVKIYARITAELVLEPHADVQVSATNIVCIACCMALCVAIEPEHPINNFVDATV